MRANISEEQRARLEAVQASVAVELRQPSVSELLRVAVDYGIDALEADNGEAYRRSLATADAMADWLDEEGSGLKMSQLDEVQRLLWYLLLRGGGGVAREVRTMLLRFGVDHDIAVEAAGIAAINIMEVS